MQELYKNLFNSSPHPCVCYKAYCNDSNGMPKEFGLMIFNSAYEHMFESVPQKVVLPALTENTNNIDWFSFYSMLWKGKDEINEFHYFHSARREMQVGCQRLDGDIVVTWFYDCVKELKQNKKTVQDFPLENFADKIPGIAVHAIDVERKVKIWNKACEDFYGYSSKEAIGNDILELIVPDHSHPEVLQRIDKLFESGHKGESSYGYLKNRDGDIRPVLSHQTLFNYSEEGKLVLSIDLDMTLHRVAEENIKKLSLAADQSPVSIVITNTDGVIEYANSKFYELTGYSREEVIGKTPRILKSGFVSHQSYVDLWKTVKSGKIWRGEFVNRKKNGDLYFELATIAPIFDKQGGITHFVGVKQDITQNKKIEQELIDARENARKSDMLKAAFLQNMSHEIRTPMNAILGFSELAKMPNTSDEKRASYLSIVIESSHRLLGVVDDIMDISLIETGNIMFKSNPIRLEGFMHELFRAFKDRINNEVDLEMPVIDKELQCSTLVVDSARLKQVMEKLLSNAVKFTRQGEIKFGCRRIGSTLRFFVEDTGIGIQPNMYDLIFQPFYQLDMGATRTFGGNGLGLTIASRIVEKMGSVIKVDSKPGKGSVFYFDIWPENDDNDTPASSFTLLPQRENFNILIAEDDEVNFILLREILNNEFGKRHMLVIRAATGNEAIEICREREDIDLVLMDIKMPDVDGITATRQIKSIRPKLPVIAQTAFAMSGDRDEMIKAGCDDYFTKPLRTDLFIDKISKYLKVKI